MTHTTSFITGGAGFIGRHLTRELASHRNHSVRVLDYHVEPGLFDTHDNIEVHEIDIRDLDPDDHHELFEGVDDVYHLAGLLGTTELYDRVEEAQEINVGGTINLLEAMRANDVTRILYMSKPNMWESNIYTITKTNAQRYVNAYRDVYGFEAVTVKPYNVYGPEERIDIYRKAIPYFIVSALNDDALEVFGSGEQTMDCIHVEDTARVLADVMASPRAVGETIDIGTGESLAVNDLASLIIGLTGGGRIKHVPMRRGEDEDTIVEADSTTLERVIGNPEWRSIHDGLQDTIEYYEDHLESYANDIYEFSEEHLDLEA